MPRDTRVHSASPDLTLRRLVCNCPVTQSEPFHPGRVRRDRDAGRSAGRVRTSHQKLLFSHTGPLSPRSPNSSLFVFPRFGHLCPPHLMIPHRTWYMISPVTTPSLCAQLTAGPYHILMVAERTLLNTDVRGQLLWISTSRCYSGSNSAVVPRNPRVFLGMLQR
jgi:hypothetical protein